MRTYRLDLETLLPLLEEFKQDGVLSLELPTGIPGVIKERCAAKISLIKGKAASCSLEKGGQVLAQGSEVLRLLYSLGSQNWQLDDTQSSNGYSTGSLRALSPSGRVPLSQLATRIPNRAAHIDQRQFDVLSRQQKRVLMLVDGVKTVEKIATILFPGKQDIPAVIDILRDLARMRLITMENI